MKLKLKYRLRRNRALATRYKMATLLIAAVVVSSVGGLVVEWRQTTDHTAMLQAQTREQDAKLEKIVEQRELAAIKEAEQKKAEAAAAAEQAQVPDAATDASAVSARPTSKTRAGDLLALNSIKNEYIYYGGRFIISPSMVTISISNPAYTPITVSTPDGAAVGMPGRKFNDQGWIFVGVDANVVSETVTKRATWPMVVDAVSQRLTPGMQSFEIVGTYTIDNRTYEYRGTLQANVIP